MFIHIDISVLIIAKLFVEILYSRETALDPVRLLWDSPNPNIPRINSIIITSPTIALSPSSTKRINIEALNTSSTPLCTRQGARCWAKGRTPNIRYSVAKLRIVSSYVLFDRLSQSFERKSSCFRRAFNESNPAFTELSTKVILNLLSQSFQRKPSCFRRGFNERHPDPAFLELSTKAILIS